MGQREIKRNSSLIPEIEGLRAVAVLTVLLYHAHLGFSGGYVGVDVFFVVSGFLITGLLLREFEGSGRISLREFYARRARRLLPAAALVLVVTLVLANRLLDPIRAHDNAVDALYATGFVANFRFAVAGADYFQQGLAPSTLQHWWSLAVEEQFYLVWPGLLALVWWLTTRVAKRAAVRGVALVLVSGLGAASFLLGRHLTSVNPSWGYFATWSRGWELSAGAAGALLWSRRERLAESFRALAGWVGLVLVLFAALRFDVRTAFPGTAAWVPVGGTLLVIASVGTRRGPGVLLSLTPLQWTGARSYGLYLWHWPLLVLLEARVTDPGPWARLGTLAVGGVAAALTYRFVENPVRHLGALVRSPWRSLTVGVALSGAVIVSGLVILRLSDDLGGDTGYVAPVLTTVAATTTPTSTTSVPLGAGDGSTGVTGSAPAATSSTTTTTLAPAEELERRIASELRPLIEASSRNDLVPDNLRPSLRKIPDDKTLLFSNGCMAKFPVVTNPTCEFGDTSASTTIVLFGDSHVAQWFPGLDAAGKRNGWKILALTKMGCPSADVTVGRFDGSAYTACNTWREKTIRRIIEARPALVILTNFRYSGLKGFIPMDVWKSALRRTVKKLVDAGEHVLLMSDSPSTWEEQSTCIARHRRSLSRCNVDREEATRPAYTRVNREVAEELGAMSYEVTDWMCTEVCPAVIGDIAVYLDKNHITNTYGEFLSPYLELVVKAALQKE